MSELSRSRCERCGNPDLLGLTDARRLVIVDVELTQSSWYAHVLTWRDGGARLRLLSLAGVASGDTPQIRPRLYSPHLLHCQPADDRRTLTASGRR